MKKMNKRIVFGIGLFGLFIFSSCNVIGLGEAVDLTAPEVTITSHEDNDTIPSEFMMCGTAYDNSAVKELFIDCESQALHYKTNVYGLWYKKNGSETEWTQVSETEGVFKREGKNYTWKIYIHTEDGALEGNTYNFTATVTDEIGNSGKKSKVDLSLIRDENNPDVSIYKPELLTGSYSDVQSVTGNYALRDGNVLSKLMNGTISLSGRLSGSIDFKALKIEFDDGGLESGLRMVTGDADAALTVEEIAENAKFPGESEPYVYFSKTLTRGQDGIEDLRTWTLTVRQNEWVTDSINSSLLSCGTAGGSGTLIRVVATSLSSSLAWEKKVIGWFVWWPEADKPWITLYAGDSSFNGGDNTYSVYPSSNFSGTVQDDDGIASLKYKVRKMSSAGNWEDYSGENAVSISEAGAKYSAFTVKNPSENGVYEMSFTVTDIYGSVSTEKRYVRTLDVTPPKINLASPLSGSSVLADSNGDVTFSGSVTDDGSVQSLSLIYLNPAANDDPNNIVRYMSGNESDWGRASVDGTETGEYYIEGTETSYKNKVYKIPLELEDDEYKFSTKLNLFDDLEISSETKPLVNQYFVLRAVDNGGTKTVTQIVLSGDSDTPEASLTSIQQFDSTGSAKTQVCSLAGSEVPNFAVVQTGDYAILKGKWSDNSVKAWNNDKSKIDLAFEWGDGAEFEYKSHTLNADGSWSFEVKITNLPKASKSLNFTVTDQAGNSKTVTKSVFIETSELGLMSIGSENDDGSYSVGKDILILLNFTKNTVVKNGTPSLTLNNGGSAVYVSGGTEGSATSQHVFKYTVAESDSDTKNLTNGTLDVTALNLNGASYYDAKVTGASELSADDLALPAGSASLGLGRKIVIDKTAPKVKAVTAVSSSGYYKEEKTVLLLLTFDETVTIENGSALKLKFAEIPSPQDLSAEANGSNVIFTYVVSGGENSLSPLALSQIADTSSVIVKDSAGNMLTDWSVSSGLGNSIYVDTEKPEKPVITKGWGTNSLVTAATSFTLSGIEEGASCEYSIDGGENFLKYTDAVTLSNNETYKIKARQTDRAGNVSDLADFGSITVEKVDFLNKITADTASGTYSVNKGGVINGRLIFKKDVTISGSPYVTLNVLRSGSNVTCPLTKAASASISGGCDYTFTYTIQDGDSISDNAKLNVTGWSFDSVRYDTGDTDTGTVDYDLGFSETIVSGNGKALNENKSIYILTGNPTFTAALDGSVASDGSVSGEKLVLSFDRGVSKVGNYITLSLDGDTYSDSYIAPAVISADNYSSAFDAYYSEGLNGAVKGSNNKLTNDNTTKYVLDFGTEPDNTTLTALFKTAGWNKVQIPVVSSAVSLSEDKKTVTIDLSGTYKLPVKGAKYKITVPANTFSDSVQNKNTAFTGSGSAKGIEPPVIRVNKGKQTITAGSSTSAGTVTMPDTAEVRIDCQTPGATIYYGKTEKTTSSFVVKKSSYFYDTESNAAGTIPTAPSASSAGTAGKKVIFTLGSSVSGYSSATGLKAAITARAYKNSVYSSYAYEYATRTVLKLKIDGSYSSTSDGVNNGTASAVSDITENGSNLKLKQLKVWVVGGDSTYGGNSISPFPLAWHESSGFKLMKMYSGFDNSMYCECYWISWDITTATYHGFVIGDIPSDAATKGPTQWYSGEGAWDAQKGNYILYPGETLEMQITSSGDYPNGSFHWPLKNHGTR